MLTKVIRIIREYLDPEKLNLCEQCLGEFRKLKYDPNSKRTAIEGFAATIAWYDEHPQFNGYYVCVERCLSSSKMILCARNSIWLTGTVETQLRRIWRDTREQIPNWPGFNRLSLNQCDTDFLKGVLAEQIDFLNSLRK